MDCISILAFMEESIFYQRRSFRVQENSSQLIGDFCLIDIYFFACQSGFSAFFSFDCVHSLVVKLPQSDQNLFGCEHFQLAYCLFFTNCLLTNCLQSSNYELKNFRNIPPNPCSRSFLIIHHQASSTVFEQENYNTLTISVFGSSYLSFI